MDSMWSWITKIEMKSLELLPIFVLCILKGFLILLPMPRHCWTFWNILDENISPTRDMLTLITKITLGALVLSLLTVVASWFRQFPTSSGPQVHICASPSQCRVKWSIWNCFWYEVWFAFPTLRFRQRQQRLQQAMTIEWSRRDDPRLQPRWASHPSVFFYRSSLNEMVFCLGHGHSNFSWALVTLGSL